MSIDYSITDAKGNVYNVVNGSIWYYVTINGTQLDLHFATINQAKQTIATAIALNN